jgi:serine/threonine protein kinase
VCVCTGVRRASLTDGRAQSQFAVRLHYAFQTDDKLYLVLDYVNGGELFQHLRRMERFSEDLTRFYAAEIVIALHDLHGMGILYRCVRGEGRACGAKRSGGLR